MTKIQPFVAEIECVVESVAKSGMYKVTVLAVLFLTEILIAHISDKVRRSDLENVFALYGELKGVWISNNIPCFGFAVYKDKKMLQLPSRLAIELKYVVVILE